jgi:hypothetical protein
MPNDLDIQTSVFTYQGIKLLYKEGITEQWIGKAMENAGYNLWTRMALSDQLTIGSSPAPTDPNHGGCILVWHEFDTPDTTVVLDTSIDWRDRFLISIGSVGDDEATSHDWGASSGDMNKQGVSYGQDDLDSKQLENQLGQDASAGIGMMYTYRGVSSISITGNRPPIVFRRDDAGEGIGAAIHARLSDGALIGTLYEPDSLSETVTLSAGVWYFPQAGFKSL